jgi:hypothetical protein
MFKKHGALNLDAVKDQPRHRFHGHHVLLLLDSVFPASNDSSSRHWVTFNKDVLGRDSFLLVSTRALAVTFGSDAVITFQPLEACSKLTLSCLPILEQRGLPWSQARPPDCWTFVAGYPLRWQPQLRLPAA